MTLRFLRAIAASLQFEGDTYTDDPDDRGGATRYGLTWRFLRSHIGPQAIHPSEISVDDALPIYWEYIWQPQRFDEYVDPDVACKVFDMCLPMGELQAVKYLQRALARLLRHALVDDGVIGPRTLDAVSVARAKQLPVINALIEQSVAHYEDIIKRSPSQAKWRNGWLRRAAYDPRRYHV